MKEEKQEICYPKEEKEALIQHYVDFSREHGMDSVEEMQTNFVDLHYTNKILILDTIINHAKDVFGPFGGIYGEVIPEQIGKDDYLPSWYKKSRDGHNFFSSLRMLSYYGNTVLMGVRQLTKYISGYEGETSRDGTTSLAMVGCHFAKYALMVQQKFEEERGIRIPTTMIHRIFDLLVYAGTTVIEQARVPVYEEETSTYINHGFETILHAISTTVDGDGRFVEAFRTMMQHCVDKKYNIMSGNVNPPNRMFGNPGISLDIISGLKLRAEHIIEDISGGFRDHTSVVYLLDGFINAENRDIYVEHFHRWIKRVCNATDDKGRLVFHKESNPDALDAPVLLITRKQDWLLPVYSELVQKGIAIREQGHPYLVKPIIMLAHDTEDSEVFYRDVTSVFPESMISLNGFNRYIQTLTRKEGMEDLGILKHVPKDQYRVDELFPVPDFKTGIFTGKRAFTNDSYDPLLGDQNTAVWELEEHSGVVENLICQVAYTGHGIFLTPQTEEVMVRAKSKREELLQMLHSYSVTATEDNRLYKRLDCFNGISITGTITYRSNDEYTQLMTLYEDAIGVFQSTHAWGVLAGGNVTIPKFHQSIWDYVVTQVRSFTEYGYDPSMVDVYSDFAKELLHALQSAYYATYEYLDPSPDRDQHFNEVIRQTQEGHENTIDYRLQTFNSVAGTMTTNIVEAARTTADVFTGACSIAKDMLSLKRIFVPSLADWREAQQMNKNRTLHPMYTKYITK